MIIKYRAIRTSLMSEEQTSERLKSHLKYLQYDQHHPDPEQMNTRHFFTHRSEQVDRRWIQRHIMQKQDHSIAYSQLLLCPDDDELVSDFRLWTRAIMHDLAQWFGLELTWYAIEHHTLDQSHIHLLIQGTGRDQKNGRVREVRFTAQALAYLRERCRAQSGYAFQRLLTETLQDLDQFDLISNEPFQ